APWALPTEPCWRGFCTPAAAWTGFGRRSCGCWAVCGEGCGTKADRPGRKAEYSWEQRVGPHRGSAAFLPSGALLSLHLRRGCGRLRAKEATGMKKKVIGILGGMG